MVIGLAPFTFINNDISANISQIENGLALAQGKADLLCFGEAFLQGFDSMNWKYEHDFNVAVEQNSKEIEYLCALTFKYNVDLLFGYLERESERLYSSCMVIENGKILHNYRRISKGWKYYWITDEHYCEGNKVEDFFYKGKSLRIALCGDMWDYPERFKTESTLLWPVCCNFAQEEWDKQYSKEYAEQAFLASNKVLFVDAIDSDSECSKTACCFENGSITAELNSASEKILYIDI